MQNIRNFSIVAHIDHGKSTLSDRIIQVCMAVEERDMKDRILDSMDLERERGITIKSQTVRLKYIAKDGKEYIFNLMDTPGHVDFSYEVSRCLSACEGTVLLVDATQGVQAQTVSNAYKAIDVNNEILPCFNKIDLPSSNVDKAIKEVEDVIGIPVEEMLAVSGKTGEGVVGLLESIIKKIPAPTGSYDAPLQAMLVDAWYDTYLGVLILIRVKNGVIKKGDKIKMYSTGSVYPVEGLGFFMPKKTPVDEIKAGEVGYIVCGIKNVKDCSIGDTILHDKDDTSHPLEGFKKVKQVVFAGIYAIDSADYPDLKDGIERLCLNDSSVSHEYETSSALGFGLRCGFLGLLHMEVFLERLRREFNLDIISTAPSVVYKFELRHQDEMIEVHNPAEYPDPVHIKATHEPMVNLEIVTPSEYLGNVVKLCIEKRGRQKNLNIVQTSAFIEFTMPLSEIIFDFHDKIKSLTRGYASFEWSECGYEASDIVKVGIMLNGEKVDALSILTHRVNSERRGREICIKLKELIPRHMFAIPIQAAIGGKIIARETIQALRKDVTAKCYGGDVSRKKKLLEKQKAGKKKMKAIGSVDVPQEVFIKVYE